MKLRKFFLAGAILSLAAYTACGEPGIGDDPTKKPASTDTHHGTDSHGTDGESDDAHSDAKQEGTDTEEDDDPGAEDNIIENGSFEEWEEVVIYSHDKKGDSCSDVVMMPKKWNGSKSNVYNGNVNADASALFVYDYTDAAHDGSHALQAQRIITAGTPKMQRFTTQAKTVWPGEYKCSVWVRGSGEINFGYINSQNSVTSYSGKTKITSSGEWKLLRHNFKIDKKMKDSFEFVLGLYETKKDDHLQIDDIVCTRKVTPCDSKTCESWQICQNVNDTEAKCIAAVDFCERDEDCGVEYKSCNSASHQCLLNEGRCETTLQCKEEEDICDTNTNTCYHGNYCDSHTCNVFQECSNEMKACVLKAGKCFTSADCSGDTPVCNIVNHACESMNSKANILMYVDDEEKTHAMGAFEDWIKGADYVSNQGYHEIDVPAGWFGLEGDSPNGHYFPVSEIKGENVSKYTARSHSGNSCMQIKFGGQPADRLTSQAFTVAPSHTYTCTYYVSGRGQYRHRYYCGGWGKDTQYATVDSDSEWTQVSFDLKSMNGSSECYIIFYGSNTQAEEHLLIDDLSCSDKYQYLSN